MIRYYINNKEVTEMIDFGITNVGVSHLLEVKIKNDSPYPSQLTEPFVNDPDMKIKSYPERLAANESGTIIFEFTPPKNRRDPLLTQFGFKEIVG